MDKLDKIFEMQKLLDDDISARRHLEFSTEEWMQKEVLAMLSELSEVLDEVNFKWWKNEKPVNTDNVRDEIVDIVHFVVSMALRSASESTSLFSSRRT